MRRKLYRHSSVVRRLKPRLYHPFDHISDLRSLKSASGLGGIYGIPRLLWVSGDGNNPTISPFKNSLTKSGSPSIETSPYELVDGSSVNEEVHDGNSNRRTTESLNPGIDDDFVILLMGKYGYDGGGYYSYFFGTRNTGRGIRLGLRHDTNQMYCFLNGDAQKNLGSQEIGIANGYFITITVVNRDDKGVTAFNGDFGSLVDVSGNGSLANDQGVGIASLPGGGGDIVDRSSIIALAVWIDNNIAPFWETDSYSPVKELTHQLSGIYPQKGNSGIFTRNSAASWKNKNGVWAIASAELPRAGDSGGLRIAPERTTECPRNINPQNVTALTWTGAKSPTDPPPDDSTALNADGCGAWGPAAYEYANDTGSTQYVRMSAQVGNVNDRSLQALTRIVSGSGTVKLGLYDESAGTFVGTAIHDGYDERTIIDGQTPGDTDCTLALEVPDGVTVRWIAQGMETGPTCTTPIPNVATGAGATRAAEVLTTSHTPSDIQGSFKATITPMNWSGIEAGDATIITRDTAAELLYANGSTAGLNSDLDGTTSLEDIQAPADGVAQVARVRWSGPSMSLDVDGTRDIEAFDKTLDGADELVVAVDAEVGIVDLKAYDKGGER
jgi:hypothetical protein